MGRVVTVVVVDSNNHTAQGIKVHTYGSAPKMTDKRGVANLALDTGSVTIYVNGFSAYHGAVSRVPDQLIVNKMGQIVG